MKAKRLVYECVPVRRTMQLLLNKYFDQWSIRHAVSWAHERTYGSNTFLKLLHETIPPHTHVHIRRISDCRPMRIERPKQNKNKNTKLNWIARLDRWCINSGFRCRDEFKKEYEQFAFSRNRSRNVSSECDAHMFPFQHSIHFWARCGFFLWNKIIMNKIETKRKHQMNYYTILCALHVRVHDHLFLFD